MIAQMRDQFFTLLVDIGFVEAPAGGKGRGKARYRGAASDKSASYNANADNLQLVTAVIAAGLYPNVIIVKPGAREPKLLTRIGEVFLHPCSVNFNRSSFGSRYLVYHEKVRAHIILQICLWLSLTCSCTPQVKTTKVYVRDASAVPAYSLLLFGGRVEVQHADSTITVDNWLTFQAPPKVAVLIKLLRRRMDELLRHRIQVRLSRWLSATAPRLRHLCARLCSIRMTKTQNSRSP